MADIRPCGGGWACCDGNCATCAAARTTTATATTKEMEGKKDG